MVVGGSNHKNDPGRLVQEGLWFADLVGVQRKEVHRLVFSKFEYEIIVGPPRNFVWVI